MPGVMRPMGGRLLNRNEEMRHRDYSRKEVAPVNERTCADAGLQRAVACE
jgi:hypothetical protein